MPIFKDTMMKWVRLFVFLFGMCLINQVLTFILFPARSAIRYMEHEIASEENKYDLIAFGSSELETCWDTGTADDVLGIKTYNFGGTMSNLQGGIRASFYNAMTFQKPEYVVIMLSMSMMESDDESAAAYASMAPYMENQIERWKYFFKVSGNDDDGVFGRLFVWPARNTVSVMDNVNLRLDKRYYDYDETLLSDLEYAGGGYRPYFDQCDGFGKDNLSDKWIDKREKSVFLNEEMSFLQEPQNALDQVLDYCSNNKIKAILVSQPRPVTSIYSEKRYYSFSTQIKEYAKKKKVPFWDLNLLRNDIVDRSMDDFFDSAHVNAEGAKKYTAAICDLIKMEENGEDTSSLFYLKWKDYTDSVDKIVAVYTILKRNPNKKSFLTAHSVTGGKVVPEYKFVLRDDKSGKEMIIKDYSEDNKCYLTEVIDIGKIVRVYARAKGCLDNTDVRYYDYCFG